MPGHLLYVWEQLLGVIVAPNVDGTLEHGVGQFLLAFRVLGHGCWRISHAPPFEGGMDSRSGSGMTGESGRAGSKGGSRTAPTGKAGRLGRQLHFH